MIWCPFSSHRSLSSYVYHLNAEVPPLPPKNKWEYYFLCQIRHSLPPHFVSAWVSRLPPNPWVNTLLAPPIPTQNYNGLTQYCCIYTALKMVYLKTKETHHHPAVTDLVNKLAWHRRWNSQISFNSKKFRPNLFLLNWTIQRKLLFDHFLNLDWNYERLTHSTNKVRTRDVGTSEDYVLICSHSYFCLFWIHSKMCWLWPLDGATSTWQLKDQLPWKQGLQCENVQEQKLLKLIMLPTCCVDDIGLCPAALIKLDCWSFIFSTANLLIWIFLAACAWFCSFVKITVYGLICLWSYKQACGRT